MTDRIGRTIGRRAAGRVLALLWLFAAVLAMPLVASAQIVAARTGAFGPAGNFSSPDGTAPEAMLSRHAIRAAAPADLRFIADRTDSKPVPGGPDPFLLPFSAAPPRHQFASVARFDLRNAGTPARVAEAAQARAPPSASPIVR